jgi:hypothetical protein
MKNDCGSTDFGDGKCPLSSIATIAILVVILLLTGRYAIAEDTVQSLQPIERKWISPSSSGPSQTAKAPEPITISVEKPSFVGLVFAVRYRVRNLDCKGFNPVLFLETGNGRVPLEFIEIYRLPDGVMSKTFTISVDKYEPGSCLWEPVSIDEGEYDTRHQSFDIENFGYHGGFFSTARVPNPPNSISNAAISRPTLDANRKRYFPVAGPSGKSNPARLTL